MSDITREPDDETPRQPHSFLLPFEQTLSDRTQGIGSLGDLAQQRTDSGTDSAWPFPADDQAADGAADSQAPDQVQGLE